MEEHYKILRNDMDPRFLTMDEIKMPHKLGIELHGGASGIRDLEFLESAIVMPKQTFGGEYLHEGIAAKAAVYLYHICQNHAFIDGNKRCSLLACELFLNFNEYGLTFSEERSEHITLGVASGQISKDELTVLIVDNIERIDT